MACVNRYLLLILCSLVVWTSRGVRDVHMVLMQEAKLAHRRDLIKFGRSDANALHTLVFVLERQNKQLLIDELYAVSTPGSPRYGQHYTRQSLKDLVSVPENRDAVLTWLNSLGRPGGKQSVQRISVSEYDDYIFATASIATWEEALDTHFFDFSSSILPKAQGRTVPRTHKYHLPVDIAAVVELVLNTVNMPPSRVQRSHVRMQQRQQKQQQQEQQENAANDVAYSEASSTTSAPTPTSYGNDASAYYDYVTPTWSYGLTTLDLLNTYYKISSNVGSKLASQAVVEFDNESFSQTDLLWFLGNNSVPLQNVTKILNGGENEQACRLEVIDPSNATIDCYEASLDLQYLIGISQVTPTTYLYIPPTDYSFYTDLFNYFTFVMSMAKPPLVQSISWGDDEQNYDSTLLDYASSVAASLSLMGVTIVIAAGDDGALSPLARPISGMGENACFYAPSFPATIPYVVAVGATTGVEFYAPEVLCEASNSGVITGGGGFSFYYDRPSYQDEVVNSYLTSQYASLSPDFNQGGRAFPDVSVLGSNYPIKMGGTDQVLYGTSASAPVFAGMISLINARLLDAGYSSVGFINQALYATADEWSRDITCGSNKCSAEENGFATCCEEGFKAAVGFDVVSGFGSLSSHDSLLRVFKNAAESNKNVNPPPPSPTKAPPLTLNMICSQTIKGCSAKQFYSNPYAYDAAIALTVVAAVSNPNIGARDIQNITVSLAASGARRFLLGASSSSAISVTYTITSTSPDISYDAVSASLASNAGSFNTFLSIFALQYGASGLVGASAGAITTMNKGPASATTSSIASPITLSSAAGGIAVAALVLVGLLCVGVVFFSIVKSRGQQRGGVARYTNVELHTTTELPMAHVHSVGSAGGAKVAPSS